MNTTLETVADYVSDARTLLQDVIAPYRYDDTSLLAAFNVMLLETRRLRPDLFVYNLAKNGAVPTFTEVDESKVDIEQPFRLALVYGLVGHAIARDTEDVQDRRATSFLDAFSSVLIGTRPAPLMGAVQRGDGS